MTGVVKAQMLAGELRAVVGDERVLADAYSLRLYSYDAGTDAATGDMVVIPENSAQLESVVRIASRYGASIVPRGGGTGLSGGSIPCEGGIMLSFGRLRRVLALEPEQGAARVEAGIVNAVLGRMVAPLGMQFAPDPSSQLASTIGGNVAMNAGGPHTLAYGVTANHVLGLRLLLANGEIAELGGIAPDAPGYDLTGLVVGSEGTLGVVSEVTVRLIPLPEAVTTLLVSFDTIEAGAACVGAIIRSGVIPAALEMMDNATLRAVEPAVHAGYPIEAAAVLLIELEGLAEATDAAASEVALICREQEATEVRVARDQEERTRLWKGRKGAGGAFGRLAPNYYVMDGVVPRDSLPAVLQAVERIAAEYQLQVATLLHAGDGNLHPNLLFDSEEPGAIERVRAAGSAILRVCLEHGGSLTGEHGIGVEKLDLVHLMFSEDDLAIMTRVREVFDPEHRCNPGKLFPTPGRCIELQGRALMEAHW